MMERIVGKSRILKAFCVACALSPIILGAVPSLALAFNSGGAKCGGTGCEILALYDAHCDGCDIVPKLFPNTDPKFAIATQTQKDKQPNQATSFSFSKVSILRPPAKASKVAARPYRPQC